MSTDMKTLNKYMSLAAITLAFSFTFLSRYIWSPLMADVSGEFGINATQAGLYMSAFLPVIWSPRFRAELWQIGISLSIF